MTIHGLVAIYTVMCIISIAVYYFCGKREFLPKVDALMEKTEFMFRNINQLKSTTLAFEINEELFWLSLLISN